MHSGTCLLMAFGKPPYDRTNLGNDNVMNKLEYTIRNPKIPEQYLTPKSIRVHSANIDLSRILRDGKIGNFFPVRPAVRSRCAYAGSIRRKYRIQMSWHNHFELKRIYMIMN